MAHDRDQVAMPPRLGPKDAEAVLRVVEGDALDEAGEDLAIREPGLPRGAPRHDVPSTGAVSSSFTNSNCRARSAADIGLSRSGS